MLAFQLDNHQHLISRCLSMEVTYLDLPNPLGQISLSTQIIRGQMSSIIILIFVGFFCHRIFLVLSIITVHVALAALLGLLSCF